MTTLVATKPQPPSFLTAAPKPLAWQIPGTAVAVPWSTPVLLRAQAAAIVFCSVLVFFAGKRVVEDSRAAIKSVGQDCAPSIVAAKSIRADFADLDANLVNNFLCAPDSKEGRDAVKNAAARHQHLSEQLVTAAKNITFDNEERRPITTMIGDFATYESKMATARTLELKGDTAGMLATERDAAKLMHEHIIPAADTLDLANKTELDRSYNRHQHESTGAVVWLVIVSLLLATVTIRSQFYLTRKMHRLINPGLLAATVIALGSLVVTVSQYRRASSQLRLAVDDAFASVRLLWEARAIGFDANGEESRYLFDTDAAGSHERDFYAKTSSIADPPANRKLDDMLTIVNAGARLPNEFHGALARELGNITFPGEREAAAEALRTFSVYMDVDTEIRRLEKTGHHAEAKALCISEAPGGSNAVFDRFDVALEETVRINQHYFENAIKNGLQTLDRSEWEIGICVLLVAGCSIAGFWPRLKEY